MTRGELDYKLRLFVKYAEKEKAPPPWLLRFIAEGVERYRKDRDNDLPYGPLWTVQPKAKGPGTDFLLQAAALEDAGIHRDKAARILGIEEKSEKTHQRYITEGRKHRDSSAAGAPWIYRTAIELLLEGADLNRKEREALQGAADKADPSYPEDDVEPSYTD